MAVQLQCLLLWQECLPVTYIGTLSENGEEFFLTSLKRCQMRLLCCRFNRLLNHCFRGKSLQNSNFELATLGTHLCPSISIRMARKTTVSCPPSMPCPIFHREYSRLYIYWLIIFWRRLLVSIQWPSPLPL